MESNTNESTSGSFWAPSPSHAPSSSSSYALNGKIMFISTIVIFVAVTFVFCFRIHARLFFHHRNRRRRIRENLSSLADADPVVSSSSSRPLDPSVLVKISAFVYSSKGAGADAVTTPFDCAVCLSEFENEEEGRVLPICNHVFHVECIDTWFKSRSTCPLCRFPVLVQPPKPENPLEPSGSACPSSNTDKVSEQYRIGSSQVRFPPESSRRQPIELLTVLVDVSPGVGLSGDTGSKQPSQRGSSLKGIWSI